MIVGLLECDHIDDRFRGIAGDLPDMYAALIGGRATIKPYDVVGGELPPEPAACDAWMITGSRRSVYDDLPWIHALGRFVRDVQVTAAPCVGVCFGHQMIAHALGGRVARAPGGWGAGNHSAMVDDRRSWMRPAAADYGLLYMHKDQVVELPPDGVALGHTDHCPVALLAVGSTMLGVQGHPEFPAAYLRALLDDRVERIGAATTDVAVASLTTAADSALIADWMIGFLSGPRS